MSATRSVKSKHGARMIASSSAPDADVSHAVPIVQAGHGTGQLYFMISKYKPKNSDRSHFFSIDNVLRYDAFFVDFGPLNLGNLYRFVNIVNDKLSNPALKDSKIYYYCDKDAQKIANACWLIGAYQVIVLRRHPMDALRRLREFLKRSVPFRDATMGLCTYRCTVEHCLFGLYRAMNFRFLDLNEFNLREYEHFEKVDNGDLNLIVPGKFLAFAGPHHSDRDEEGYPALTPDFYLPIWKKYNVSTIIRLNKKCYDKEVWTAEGYRHFDLYFIDGTTPSNKIINEFLQICEDNDLRYRKYAESSLEYYKRRRSELTEAMKGDSSEMDNAFRMSGGGVVAVHCKAGLGRTGSLIGCYMMKHYGWTAAEVIAWMRICRPGSVLGPQQQFLQDQQPKMWAKGETYRRKYGLPLVGRRMFTSRKRLSCDSARQNIARYRRKEVVMGSPSPPSSMTGGSGSGKDGSDSRTGDESVSGGDAGGSTYKAGDICHSGHIVVSDPRMDTRATWKEAQRLRRARRAAAAASSPTATGSASVAASKGSDVGSSPSGSPLKDSSVDTPMRDLSKHRSRTGGGGGNSGKSGAPRLTKRSSSGESTDSRDEADQAMTDEYLTQGTSAMSYGSSPSVSGSPSRPLPTDPGQFQGSTLRSAKIKRTTTPHRTPHHRVSPTKVSLDSTGKDVSMEARDVGRTAQR